MNNKKSTRHAHADVIIAWAEGQPIEYYDEDSKSWILATSPQ